eukprot:CAMPEP_0172867926 /NCGR_PEP_ID=MMETSP1075-20121228/84973_1 /TAXON_ID=2916 /ORGANISM="Ceratium fusus, Strain PA161109" /LENGTH=91 /DNA_ID=CAMNT_0013717407 /DNA_START=160 /DNA_END=433 /DNA_ORIENTATION=+
MEVQARQLQTGSGKMIKTEGAAAHQLLGQAGKPHTAISEAKTMAVTEFVDAQHFVSLMCYCGNDGVPTQDQCCCALPVDAPAPRGVFLGLG